MPVALITGAGVRVGRAIALSLAEAGYRVVCHANRSVREAEDLVETIVAAGGEAQAVVADLSQREAVQELARRVCAEYPVLDLLVNNAGLYERGAFEEISAASYGTMQAVNVEAPFFLTQGLLPSLRASGEACVINITDSAVARPYGEYAHYFVSKAGLEALTRVLAIELAPGIRVNGVAPGTVAFPPDFNEGARESIRRAIPMQTTGTEQDIAEAVLYLARRGTFTTGQILRVDGGRSVA
ncbi:MAG: SDR family oxidoreductase [Myxococcota bacterium]|nr:SDR family oxidoreductase [Myxococcota bacterium]